jgi:hypothetical protein
MIDVRLIEFLLIFIFISNTQDKKNKLSLTQINKFIENIKNVDFIDFFKNMIILITITQNKYSSNTFYVLYS